MIEAVGGRFLFFVFCIAWYAAFLGMGEFGGVDQPDIIVDACGGFDEMHDGHIYFVILELCCRIELVLGRILNLHAGWCSSFSPLLTRWWLGCSDLTCDSYQPSP